jgi:hypothetical protein
MKPPTGNFWLVFKSGKSSSTFALNHQADQNSAEKGHASEPIDGRWAQAAVAKLLKPRPLQVPFAGQNYSEKQTGDQAYHNECNIANVHTPPQAYHMPTALRIRPLSANGFRSCRFDQAGFSL